VSATLKTFEGGPPITDEDVATFERKHKLTLPSSYRQFLLRTNGGRPERDLFSIEGLEGAPEGRIHVFFALNDTMESCRLDWNLRAFAGRIPSHLLPIATTEGADQVCLSLRGKHGGAVFYWDGYAQPGEDNLYFLASDFDRFVASLYADMNTPGAPS
jgi:SMI1/KNR4 family protein SUKH-1